MKKHFFLIALSIFLFIKSFAYDCNTRLSYQDFERSDLVFTGRVIEVDMEKRLYRMKVIEILKGEVSDTITLSMRDKWSTTIYPEEYEYWLIFADYNQFETFSSSCSYSTRLNGYPYNAFLRPPNPEEGVTTELIYKSMHDTYLMMNKIFEINQIRSYSIKYNLDKKVDEQNQTIKQIEKSIFLQRVLSIIIIILLLFNIIKKSRAK
jgi:hypothetical protein